MLNFSLDFPFAYGKPTATGLFRQQPEDFQVDEELGYEPSGEGEHIYLHIRKRGENTAWVAEQIARLAKVKVNDVGYGGRKDRHAVTSQWFSVYFAKGNEPDWRALNSATVEVMSASRHSHKLRRGEHQRNHFVIRLRDVKVDNQTALTEKITTVFAQGVPNYFGEQRFGRGGNNLPQAQALLVDGQTIRDRQKRGLILSAARSYLFNQVLGARVKEGIWRTLLAGEPHAEPTGPLWGRGRALASGPLFSLEAEVLADWSEWCNALEHVGLQQERRALVLTPEEPHMSWSQRENQLDLELRFALSGGEFATAILREVLQLQDG